MHFVYFKQTLSWLTINAIPGLNLAFAVHVHVSARLLLVIVEPFDGCHPPDMKSDFVFSIGPQERNKIRFIPLLPKASVVLLHCINSEKVEISARNSILNKYLIHCNKQV